jgi:GTP-binding protein
MGTPDPDIVFERGRKLFAGPCDFMWAASTIDGLPPLGPAEIAFAGRSNVGKSSLLNALTGRNALARTSHTPGRTQELNFFALGGKGQEPLRLVDMPGYGYAAVSKEKIANWTRLMHAFLQGRSALMRVFVLVDGRHGLKPPDYEMFDLLDTTAMPYQVVLTKKDEMKKVDIDAVVDTVRNGIIKRPAAHPEIMFTSSKTGEGIGELRASIMQLLIERGVNP